MSWRTMKIGDLGRVVTGKTPPSTHPERFGALGDYPFFTPTDLGEDSRTPQTDRFVSEAGKNSMLPLLLPCGAAGFVCIGATIGKMMLVKEPSFTNQQINSVVVDQSAHDPAFVYYRLRTLRETVRAHATGAATPIVNKTKFAGISIRVPDIVVQRRIADILSAYDDLIENNNRRMALLEEAIHLLYREWFVYLRFPGHERVEVVDGVPAGWRRGAASDSFTVLSGGTPQTKVNTFWNGDIPFFTPKDAPGGVFVWDTEKSLTEEGLRCCNSRLFARDTLFITARGTVGKLALAQRPMAMNQSCYALEPRPPYDCHFLYCAMQETVHLLKKAATGGVFDTIIVKTFDRTPMLEVPEALVRHFSGLVRPHFAHLDALTSMNRRLREARDLLLPRLMNGSIAV